MKTTLHYLLLVFLICLTSCGGVKFINSATNLPVPPSLQQRTLYEDPSVLQYSLGSLTGYVLEKSTSTSKWVRIKQFVPDPFSTVPKILDDGQFYNSVVDNSIAVNGNVPIPMLAIAAKITNEQRMELRIEDQSLLIVDDPLIPWAALEKFVKDTPRSNSASRVWVQASMLTRMYYKVGTKTNVNATVAGSAFGADGNVYNATALTQRQSYITMLLIDLDRIEDAARNNGGVIPAAGRRTIYKTFLIPSEGIEK